MSREEFMKRLEQLLEDVAKEEREEALSYYQSYFEDAGVENEARILKELESPEKVAATIKADLGMETEESAIKTDLGMETEAGVFTEHGFEDGRFEQKHPVSIRKQTTGQSQGFSEEGGYQSQYQDGNSYENPKRGQTQYQDGNNYENPKRSRTQYQDGNNYENPKRSQTQYQDGNSYKSQAQSNTGNDWDYDYQKSSGYEYSSANSGDGRSTYSGRSGMEILLIIAIAVITSPVWLGLVTGIGGSILGIAISAVCVAGAMYVAGGVLFGVGIGQIVTSNLAVGFVLMGTGFLLLALAILATILCVWVCGKLVPWLCSVVKSLWRSIFSGKEQRA